MWKKVVLIVLAVLVVGGLIYYFVKISPKAKEQAKIKELQKISEEAGKDKFDLDGKVVSVNAAGNQIVVNIANCSNTIVTHKGQDTTLTVHEKARIVQADQDIPLTSVKSGQSVSIQGSFSGDNLTAEMITVK